MAKDDALKGALASLMEDEEERDDSRSSESSRKETGSPEDDAQTPEPKQETQGSSEDNAQTPESEKPTPNVLDDNAQTPRPRSKSREYSEDNAQTPTASRREAKSDGQKRKRKKKKKRGRKPSPPLPPGKVMSRSGKIMPERKPKGFRMSTQEVRRFNRVVTVVTDQYVDLVTEGVAPDVEIQDAEVVRAMVTFFNDEIGEIANARYSDAVERLVRNVVGEVESRVGTVEERRQGK